MTAQPGTDEVVVITAGGRIQEVKVGRKTLVTTIDFDLEGYLPDADEAFCLSCALAGRPHYHAATIKMPD